MTRWSTRASTAPPSGPHGAGLARISWSKARGAFWAGGKLYYGYDDGFLYSRTYKKGVFGAAVKLDPYHDPYWLGLPTGSGSSTYTGVVPSLFGSFNSSVTGLAYHNHRLYYTQSNSSLLQWRYFDADSGIVGSEVFSATNGIAWNDAALAFASGNDLYYAVRSTGQLRKVALVNDAPQRQRPSRSTPVATGGAGRSSWHR